MAVPLVLGYLLATGVAVGAMGVYLLLFLGVVYFGYKSGNSSSSSKQQYAQQGSSNVYEDRLYTHAYLFAAAALDALATVIVSAITIGVQFYNNIVTLLPVILIALAALPVALVVTEYHPEIYTAAANIYQCGPVRWLYDKDFGLMNILNAVRLVLDVAWPFERIVTRFTRLFLRSIPVFLLQCTGFKLLNVFVYASKASYRATVALGVWVGSPGSLITNQLNTTAAWQELLNINTVWLQILDCACARIDFLWLILFEWIHQPATAETLNYLTVMLTEFFVAVPLRSITKTNTGTVPGVTGNYGWLPNFIFVFDAACNATKGLRGVVNYEIYVIVRELVGQFDPAIFAPNTTASVTLASDWVGFLGDLGCAAVEVARKWAHLATLAVSFLVQGVIFVVCVLTFRRGLVGELARFIGKPL